MKLVLDIAPGLIGDDTLISTPGYKDCDGGRFWRGKFQTLGGWESFSSTLLGGVCRTIFSWTDGSGYLNFVFGLHNGLTVWQAGEQADITPSAFVDGEIDGTGSDGFGSGEFGGGAYGETTPGQFYPLTWSFGVRSFGELYANPRGQGIFKWENDTGVIAAPLTNAPAVVNFTMVSASDQVMALGCTDVGATYNQACIRISDVLDPTIWTPGTTNTAEQHYLASGARIVGGRMMGAYALVWTDSELYIGQRTTEWSFERVAGNCGLIGPNAAIVVGQRAFWIGSDRQFYVYSLGGSPELIVCPIREDFADNLAAGQQDKIVCASVSEFGEVFWVYPDERDGVECSRSVRLSVVDGKWAKGSFARTSFVDASPASSPVGVTYGGQIYWHERGTSADGGALSWFLETGAQYLEPGEKRFMLRKWWPDFESQVGGVSLTIYTREYPQGDETEWGPYIAPADQSQVDLRVSGRIARLVWSGNSAPNSARFGRQTFDLVTTGER